MNSTKKNDQAPVVILGLDHIVGLQTARIFARKGIPVIGVVKNKNYFCSKTKVCEEILTADTESSECIEVLLKLGARLDQKAVLVPCRDMSVLTVSRFRTALEPFFHVALPEHDVVEMLMDKLSFYNYALQEGLPVAKFFLLRNMDEAKEASEKLSYPCILKPPIKTPTWEKNTKEKAYKIFNKDEFLNIYTQCSNWTDLLMAQEWIEGSDANNYSCNCYFDENSEPLVTFVAKKLRQWPPQTGNTSLGQECRNDLVLHQTISLFKKLQYHGLGYLEMKRDERTGEYFIIEPNIGRPTGRSALAEASGIELLYSMYCDKVGMPLPRNNQQLYQGTKWIHWRADLMSALHYWRRGELTFKEWWQSVRGQKTCAVFSWSDVMPFVEEFRFGMTQIGNMVWKKVAGTRAVTQPVPIYRKPAHTKKKAVVAEKAQEQISRDLV